MSRQTVTRAVTEAVTRASLATKRPKGVPKAFRRRSSRRLTRPADHAYRAATVPRTVPGPCHTLAGHNVIDTAAALGVQLADLVAQPPNA